MKRTVNIYKILGYVGVSLLGSVVFTACINITGPDKYDVYMDKEVISPDGRNVASFYTISGGGAAGYVTTRLKIRPKSQAFKEDNNYVFEMAHADDYDLKWQGNLRLIVFYDAGANVSLKMPAKDNIQISYVARTMTPHRGR